MHARRKLDRVDYMTELRLRHLLRNRLGLTAADAASWLYSGAPHAARDALLFSAELSAESSLRSTLRAKGLPLSDAESWISLWR